MSAQYENGLSARRSLEDGNCSLPACPEDFPSHPLHHEPHEGGSSTHCRIKQNPVFNRQSSELTHIASNCSSRVLPEPFDRETLHSNVHDDAARMQPPASRGMIARTFQPPDATPSYETLLDTNGKDENDSQCNSKRQYYRIVYPGVVAVLASATLEGLRTGQYLSYGEIVMGVPCSMDERFLVIHSVLTGGYAMDASANDGSFDQGSNLNDWTSSTAALPEYKRSKNNCSYTAASSNQESEVAEPLVRGYINVKHSDVPIIEPMAGLIPHIETGTFTYRVISTTPIPLLTGPDRNAPKTNAVLLPGTVHDISIRVHHFIEKLPNSDHTEGLFLRLKFRRGWIADRRIHLSSAVAVVQEVVDIESHQSVDESSTTSSSVLSGTVSTYTSSSLLSQVSSVSKNHHRHRPPRRRRDASGHPTRGISIEGEKTIFRPTCGKSLNRSNGHVQLQNSDLSESVLTDQSMTLPPSANVSVLSEDSSLSTNQSLTATNKSKMPQSQGSAPSARGGSTAAPTAINFFLMRVLAPKGLKILDAPQFQVNRLIRNGKQSHLRNTVTSSHMISKVEPSMTRHHHSIFQTMSSRLPTTGPNQCDNAAFFDVHSKSRILPYGVLFEASTRMETTGSYNQGAGLIKLSDSSGWAVVPRKAELEHQYRNFTLHGFPGKRDGKFILAFDEVGSAALDYPTIDSRKDIQSNASAPEPKTTWVRVISRAGIPVSCPPPASTILESADTATSPSSSRVSSAAASSNQTGSNVFPSNDSDVASSVGSSFLDAMFRTPQKMKQTDVKESSTSKKMQNEKHAQANIIACGMVVEIDRYVDDSSTVTSRLEYARLARGQGWIPLLLAGKPTTTALTFRPAFRFGSFWFRVQPSRGLKVRFGPSNRAASIKSDDGEYFRFECGEFLRASEIVTVFSDSGDPIESFAKLYRNRHIRLYSSEGDFRSLPYLTVQSEWVQIHSDTEVFLEECLSEPRIERHKQGWRYNVVPENGIAVRKGPSFAAEKTGLSLFGGESIVVNERVSPAGDTMSWLRLNDGQGWIHDFDENGEQIVIAHSLRHRILSSRNRKPENEEVVYNAVISRLFRNDDISREPR
jgi:hypothetical protein